MLGSGNRQFDPAIASGQFGSLHGRLSAPHLEPVEAVQQAVGIRASVPVMFGSGQIVGYGFSRNEFRKHQPIRIGVGRYGIYAGRHAFQQADACGVRYGPPVSLHAAQKTARRIEHENIHAFDFIVCDIDASVIQTSVCDRKRRFGSDLQIGPLGERAAAQQQPARKEIQNFIHV